MKKIEAPRTWAVYAGIGIVLWVVFGAIDFANNGASWRTIAYALLEAGSIYLLFRAISTLKRERTQGR
ncbi:hypothetical protein ASF72_00485 [Arthrobacter sp. Leaf141]|nr:hypothetical protein ASF72_00485 [Arthrobacter sp. Leaf141]